ncbi:hypothetical protein [Singulisphaera sp. PoT]
MRSAPGSGDRSEMGAGLASSSLEHRQGSRPCRADRDHTPFSGGSSMKAG